MADFIRGYEGGEQMPLGGYALILGAYGGLVAAYLARTRGRALAEDMSLTDVALFGLATHKLTRTITKDWVTAPETEYEVTGSSRAQRSVDGVSPPLSFVLCKAPALGW